MEWCRRGGCNFAFTKSKKPHTMKTQPTLEETSAMAAFRRTIAENILTPQPIAQLAAECGQCPTKFKKEFGRIFGDTPHRWFIRKRLEVAGRLLETTDLPVKIIAQKAQFSTPSHFIRLFKTEFGLTPIEYRKQYSQEPKESCYAPSCGTCAATTGHCCCNRIRTGQCVHKQPADGRADN